MTESAALRVGYITVKFLLCCAREYVVYYCRTPVTQTLKGNEKQFELAGVRVIGVD